MEGNKTIGWQRRLSVIKVVAHYRHNKYCIPLFGELLLAMPLPTFLDYGPSLRLLGLLTLSVTHRAGILNHGGRRTQCACLFWIPCCLVFQGCGSNASVPRFCCAADMWTWWVLYESHSLFLGCKDVTVTFTWRAGNLIAFPPELLKDCGCLSLCLHVAFSS
jgi:hypothetical protein